MVEKVPLIGREAEIARSVRLLSEHRGLVVEGPPLSGKTRLLEHLAALVSPDDTALRLGVTCGSRVLLSGGGAAATEVTDAGQLGAALERQWLEDVVLFADDLDALPRELVEVIAQFVDDRHAMIAASISALAAPHDDGDEARSALRRLMSGGLARIPLPALSFAATREIGQSVSHALGSAGRPEDTWLTALHRLSGGSPGLAVELVVNAAAHDDLDGIEPLDLRTQPVSSSVANVARRLVSGLRSGQLRALAVLGELGPVPSSHLSFLVSGDTISALSDARLLSASTDAGTTATAELVAWLARQRVDDGKYRRLRIDVALRLLQMSARGVALTAREELFCARYTPGEAAEESDSVERACLHGMLARASLAIAHSRTPVDAMSLAERALSIAPSVDAEVAIILAASARGDEDTAGVRVSSLGAPANRYQADLFLEAHLARAVAQPGGMHERELSVGVLRSWLPQDVSWQAYVDGIDYLLSYLRQPETASLPSVADVLRSPAGVSDDDLARRAACVALVEAMRGHASRALQLIEPRRRDHSLDTEPLFDVFALHGFVLVILGEDDERLRASIRRRLAAARAADRQDQIQILAVLDAALNFARNDPRAMSSSLNFVETEPYEFLEIWLTLLRACAHVLSRDFVSAAALLERAAYVPKAWAGGSFAAVRDIARVLFELLAGQTGSARVRAVAALSDRGRRLPAAGVTMLQLARTAGLSAEETLTYAESLAQDADLRRLTELITALRAETSSSVRTGWTVLTAREQEVVAMAAKGTPSAEIARALRVSVRTVESHLHHARTRLGMNRNQRFSDTEPDDIGSFEISHDGGESADGRVVHRRVG